MVEKLAKAIVLMALTGIAVCIVLAMLKELAGFGIFGAVVIILIGAIIWRCASAIES